MLYFYIMPCMISLVYFIALKIQDFVKDEDSYSDGHLSFIGTLIICFIPMFNIFIALTVIITLMRSIMCPMVK